MHRIDTPNRAINLWGAGKDGWRDGSMVGSILPTEFNANFLNSLQEELANVIEGAGLTLSSAFNTQLYESIQRLIDAQSGNYALDTGAANAYVVAISPAIAAYTNGMTVRFRVVNGNTGASTLNAGAGAVPLVNDVAGALVLGDAPAGGIITATYDSSLNKFIITSLVASQAMSQVAADARYWTQAQADLRYVQSVQLSTPVRQTVQYASVDSNGFPNFLSAGSGLNLVISATATPILLSAAGGLSDRRGLITADTTLALTDNAINYVYGSVAADGTVTPGKSVVAPTYKFGGAPSATSGLFTFNIAKMIGYLGNGASAPQTYLTLLGEVVTSGGAITSVVNYALNGIYRSDWTNTLPGTATVVSKNHNLGTDIASVLFHTKFLTAEGGFSVGDIIVPFTNNTAQVPLVPNVSRLAAKITTGSNAGNAFCVNLQGSSSIGTYFVLTAVNSAYEFVVQRGF
jgi:hypothetical protein